MKNIAPTTLALLLMAAYGSHGAWAQTAAPLATTAQALGCLIEPERVVDVGSPVVGVIENVEVERGALVRKGQVIAVLRGDVERASLNAASTRASAEAEVQAAATSAAYNGERLKRAQDLFKQNFISEQALQQARTESKLADEKLKQAIEQRKVSQQERSVAAAQLSQRTIRSPMDGVVAERFLSAGERVDDKPLLRIAKVDPLRVQLVVPITQYGHLRVGGQAQVTPELPGAAARHAKVTLVDRVVDPASNTFRVHLELPNHDRALPAGLRCKAEYALNTPEAPAKEGGAPKQAAAAVAAPVVAAQAAPAQPEPQRVVVVGRRAASQAVAAAPGRAVTPSARTRESYGQQVAQWLAAPWPAAARARTPQAVPAPVQGRVEVAHGTSPATPTHLASAVRWMADVKPAAGR